MGSCSSGASSDHEPQFPHTPIHPPSVRARRVAAAVQRRAGSTPASGGRRLSQPSREKGFIVSPSSRKTNAWTSPLPAGHHATSHRSQPAAATSWKGNGGIPKPVCTPQGCRRAQGRWRAGGQHGPSIPTLPQRCAQPPRAFEAPEQGGGGREGGGPEAGYALGTRVCVYTRVFPECVYVCIRARPRKVFRGGRVSVSNSGPAVPTRDDWLASPALGRVALCSGLAAPAKGRLQLWKALPGVRPAPREEPGGCVRRPGTGVNQPPPQAAV